MTAEGIWVWMELKGLLGAVARAPWLPVTEPLAACVSLVGCRRCVGSLLGLLCLWLRTCDYADRFWQPQRPRKDKRPGKGKPEKIFLKTPADNEMATNKKWWDVLLSSRWWGRRRGRRKWTKVKVSNCGWSFRHRKEKDWKRKVGEVPLHLLGTAEARTAWSAVYVAALLLWRLSTTDTYL